MTPEEAQCEAEAEQAMDDADSYDVYAAWDMTPEDPEDNELFDKD